MRKRAEPSHLPKLRALLHRVHGRWRLYVSVAIGAAVGFLAPLGLPVVASLLIGWDVAAGLYLAATWIVLATSTAEEARRWASDEDENPYVMLLLVVVIILASLTGIVMMLVGAGEHGGVSPVLGASLTGATLLLSWTMLHTIFTLHYAHVYFGAPKDKPGIQFPGSTPVTHREFVYFGFCIGLTYQVSDTTVVDRRIRNLVTLQGVIAFFFNTVILALAISIVGDAIK
jgi:uncharacterized membrane protein